MEKNPEVGSLDMWSFAVYISGEDNVDGMKAKAVTTNILKDKGILK